MFLHSFASSAWKQGICHMELHEDLRQKLRLEKPEDKSINWMQPGGGHKVRKCLAIPMHGFLYIIYPLPLQKK